MNARERFQRIMRYEGVDRLPAMAVEPFEGHVLEAWQDQGLPADTTVQEFLGMDAISYPELWLYPLPAFDQKVVEEDEEYIVQAGEMGGLIRRRKEAPGTYFGYVEHPVKTRADWESYKELFKVSTSGRLGKNWGQDEIARLNASAGPVSLCLYPFFFRLGFYALGMERFMMAFYEEPDLIHDMFSFWAEYVGEVIKPVLANVKLDYVSIAEDLAYKNGPHISPKTYKEFFIPHQQPIIDMLQASGTPIIAMWTAGNCDVLLPSMIEQGFNATLAMECASDMDAVDIRNRYGRDLLLMGNIPIKALIAGPEAIDREIDRLMPLIREGGFLPALDDMVPLETPFSHYKYMIEKLQSIRLG